ncbi:hypothetical protein [Photobacterium leiognathi]|uniref:hypothetical protein n=1 Tax=Photobacterium leiognathi TaxID=553611 RepID=UPI001EDE2FAB|nr:hypothetical protein [Photobacterium leiognathi]
MKLLTIKKKLNSSVVIHNDAKLAFNFFFNQIYLSDKSLDGLYKLQLTHNHQTLYGIYTENNEIALFSGYEFISFNLSNLDLKKYVVIIYDSIKDEEVAKQAWASALTAIIPTVPTKHLEQFRRALNNSMPSNYIRYFFGKNIISQDTWAKFNSVSRYTLAKQNQKANKLITSQISIFEQLKDKHAG